MQTAISRRGVAVIVLPGDVTLRKAVVHKPRVHFHYQKPTICPSEDEIAVLAEVLNRSKNITILGGAGCAGAHDELLEIAGKLQAPIVHAMRGKEFIEYDNPYDVGMTGLLGFSSGYLAMMTCDLLLMIGTNFPYQQFFPTDATMVQIDIRGEQLGRRAKLDFGFVGDTKATLRALLPKLQQNPRSQARAAELTREMSRRDELYADFIVAASKAYGEALVSNEPQVEEFGAIYAMISRMRVMSSPRVVACAEKVMSTTIDTFFAPNRKIKDLYELVKSGKEMDPLRDFSEAAREERRAYASI